MVPLITLLTFGLLSTNYVYGTYNQLLLNDLNQLYQLGKLDGYYDDDLESRSSPDSDWTLSYRDPTMNDPGIFSEASIRDQEFIEHSPLWGYQSVSGGTGDGKENPKEVKTDKVLPAYCNPPNPCPKGYTAEDNCLENFDNSMENNRRLMAQQECPCDTEHMLHCSKGQSKIDSKSENNAQLGKMLSELEEIDGSNGLGDDKAYLGDQKRQYLVAKKSPPHLLHKRAVENWDYLNNPYFKGAKKRTQAKKHSSNTKNRAQYLKKIPNNM